jgi:hypothetical protein
MEAVGGVLAAVCVQPIAERLAKLEASATIATRRRVRFIRSIPLDYLIWVELR